MTTVLDDVEVHTKNCNEYSPNTMHDVVSGIMCHLRQESNRPEIDVFKVAAFADFRLLNTLILHYLVCCVLLFLSLHHMLC